VPRKISPRSKQRRGYHQRLIDTREPLERCLIVCEGGQTEPNYFRSFGVVSAKITVLGVGANTLSLVEQAITLSERDEYDQVWCVFDRDSNPLQNFKSAFQLAEKHGIRIAYSNEAFELWYLLHFHYRDTAMSRRDYATRLSELLGSKYEKNRRDLYELLRSQQEVAIRNAKRLLAQYNPLEPATANPSTSVHLLVEQLNRFVRW